MNNGIRLSRWERGAVAAQRRASNDRFSRARSRLPGHPLDRLFDEVEFGGGLMLENHTLRRYKSEGSSRCQRTAGRTGGWAKTQRRTRPTATKHQLHQFGTICPRFAPVQSFIPTFDVFLWGLGNIFARNCHCDIVIGWGWWLLLLLEFSHSVLHVLILAFLVSLSGCSDEMGWKCKSGMISFTSDLAFFKRHFRRSVLLPAP